MIDDCRIRINEQNEHFELLITVAINAVFRKNTILFEDEGTGTNADGSLSAIRR